MSEKKSYTLGQIAEHIGANAQGDENQIISSIATLSSATTGQIAFLANSKYKSQLADTKASAVILSENCLDDYNGNALLMKDPYIGFALTAQLLDTTPTSADDIHPSAVISPSATIGKNVAVGANAVIESDAVIADGVSIGAGCFIGKGAKIGAFTKLWSNISVYHQVEIGDHCLLQANTVIGSDGFGYANDKGQWLKIPQLGSVIVGNRVEIGAGCTIDRGALENTEIHDGVIIDNQVHVAHNVIIGQSTAIAGNSGIAGSTKIGAYCTIGGEVAISGHLTIADKTMITGNSMVVKSITESGVYSSGMPAMPNREWLKHNARMSRIEQLMNQVKVLTAEVDTLKKI